MFGEVEAGDLEAVEEEAGAARVDVVGSDALEDLADGVLDGGAVFWEWELEGGASAWMVVRMRRGFAGGVVVVAERFLAEAWAAAAAAVGEDVAALVAFGCFGWRVHSVPPPRGYFFGKVFGRKELGLDLRVSDRRAGVTSRLFCFAVKCEGPAFGRAFFVFFFLPLILPN